jgi:predicted O-linked N-acetylglucosamine transferase (SPINDLY family)
LDDAEHIYICPQTPFKFHPDFDEILSGILRADPRARLVLIGSKVAQVTDLLRRRFKKAMPWAAERITFLQPQSGLDYINLIAVSDVMLDTVHFGGGFTTNLEAFAVGTPVVTLLGEFQRGRHAYGFYKAMDFLDCVANTPEQYVEIAVRLGTDEKYRTRIKAKILKHNHVLYEDGGAVREFERFFIKTVGAATPPKRS